MIDFQKKYNLKLKVGTDFIISENHWIPNKMGVEVFVFGKTMHFMKKMEQIPKHEYLHIAQFKKYGIVLVIFHYLFYLIMNLFKYRNFGKAYLAIPFEVEARDFEKSKEEIECNMS